MLFSLFQLKEGNKFWAFKTMGTASRQLTTNERMPFGLMLGTGGGRGFLLPNWRQYALLTSWQRAEDALNFMKVSLLAQGLQQRSKEAWSVLMQPVVSKGAWGGNNPFTPLADPLQPHEPVAVLTRASIRLPRLVEFLRHVPTVSHTTDTAPGLLLKAGIGELPIVQQATFSVWKDTRSVDNFAYKMREHKEVVAKTRQRNWYSEELFARFRPVQSWGTVGGKNPLENLPA
ncbi:spheroidene monooxygenase [Flammeovirgaceae bacterium 311]|nr:spheroidene monooxygenase [Flammeovirgaceae bacterium 311]